jgi:antitoxin (DNA-binding transcriptional repressor) of toxin-antitoxin stability system
MKIAGVREFRADIKGVLSAGEPVLITRHGRVSGVYVPMDEPDRIPDDLRKDIVRVLGEHLSRQLDAAGVREKDVLEDFHAHRRRRRGR